MAGQLYIAVDLGAGSGRVFLSGVDPGELLLEEIHRFQYPPEFRDGHLRWNLGHIFSEIKHGLRSAGKRARELGRSVQSIGIDSWAVDYGLLNADGDLIADPVCYRDNRTLTAIEDVSAIVPRAEIFEKTGIQFQNFNTLFQLFSEELDLSNASQLLLLPDLINYYLTGSAVAEYTNATTTQMVNAESGNWDLGLIERVGLPPHLLPRIVPAGTILGELINDVATEVDLIGVSVVAPATHDTGSAIAGAPLSDGQAYISSGTWSLIGVEIGHALINADVARLNFTNEGGVFGTFRFLKNVMGLWIFESCRKEWKAKGLDVSYDALLNEVIEIGELQAFIFPDDPRFLNPTSMLAAIREQIEETGQNIADSPAAISKVIFDSLAFRYASVLRSIESLTGRELKSVQILGGGGRNAYLNQMTANASRMQVQTGSAEATVVGNVLVQAISAGRFNTLSGAREHVRDNTSFAEYDPEMSVKLDEAERRYASIEARFVN